MTDFSSDFRVPPPPGGLAPGRVPTFSVVIAAYQAADTVGAAIASALEQTAPPHEVIVVDDGSTDDLDGALAPFLDRIVLLRKENGGGPSAKNAASRIATGDFIAILDSDDVFLPARLEALGQLGAARPDLDLLVTDEYLEVDGEIVSRFYEHNRFAVDDQRRAILESCFVSGHPAIRRERLLELGLFDASFRMSGDWEFFLRTILAGSSAGLVDQPLLRYRLHERAVTSDGARRLRWRARVLERHVSNPHLRPQERELAQARLRGLQRRAAVAAAEAAVWERQGARRRLLDILRERGIPLAVRLKVVAAFAAPGVAGRRVRARDVHGEAFASPATKVRRSVGAARAADDGD